MSFKRILLGLFAAVILGAIGFYLVFLRPVPPFQPTGPYRIGTTGFDTTFDSAITGAPRRINIRAWYPTDASTGSRAPVASLQTMQAVMRVVGMPDFLAEERESLAFLNAPLAEGRFPVVVFNHGFASFAQQNTGNMQELASHGYILLAISHPGTSVLTEFADGTSQPYDPASPAYRAFADMDSFARRSADSFRIMLDDMQKAGGFEDYWQAMRTFARGPAFADYQPIIRQWVEDTNAVIAAVTATNLNPALDPGFDTERIATMGHSLGGITSIAASLDNPAIKAVLNLDAPFAFDIPAQQAVLRVPTCSLMADKAAIAGDLLETGYTNRHLHEHSGVPGCLAVFTGARHMNFGDLNYVQGGKLLPVLGPVDPVRFGEELNHIILNFLDRTLKGINTPYTPLFDDIVTYQEF